MGTGIDLFLDWENGIWVAGIGIWPLGMGNEALKNGNGIEVMQVDPQFFHVLRSGCVLPLRYTAISIKVVHEQSVNVEYERERLLGIALKIH